MIKDAELKIKETILLGHLNMLVIPRLIIVFMCS